MFNKKIFYTTGNLNNNNIIPLLIYTNAEISKNVILKENKGKVGIYRWINNVNNKTYIGSGVDLSKRLGSYYRIKELERKSRPIDTALIKHGHANFTLEILEYSTKENLINREQYYLDLLNPEYNILKIAGSLLGYKHSEETLIKLKNRDISEEHKKILSLVHSNKLVSQETRNKLSEATIKYKKDNPLSSYIIDKIKVKTIEREGVAVKVIDMSTNKEIQFTNQTEAGKFLGVTRQAVYNAIKRNKLIKGIYRIIK
jgi:group I intron endonuclease